MFSRLLGIEDLGCTGFNGGWLGLISVGVLGYSGSWKSHCGGAWQDRFIFDIPDSLKSHDSRKVLYLPHGDS